MSEVSFLAQTQLQIEQLQNLLAEQRQAYARDPMPSAEQRIADLKRLRQSLLDEQEALITAINQDFGNRARSETLVAELLPCLQGIDYACKRIRRWMKPSKRKVAMAFQPASAQVIYQPLGVVGIIVPWNYPLFLAIGPLTGALAAGNRVLIKMSESTPATATLLAQLLGKIFSTDQVAVVQGEADVGVAFSKLPLDHLLFTGATSIGKHVMRAAAENLTPVTLELGGKSPAIVSPSVPLADAAERIAFGKSVNAGQTCVAPDYVLVPREQVPEFVKAYQKAMLGLYPTLENNPDYTSIINPRQLQRLNRYLQDAEEKGAQIINLYPAAQERRLPHALILQVNDQMTLMQDEIFGPLLPVVPYDSLEQALDYINQRPRPLALYYFGYERSEQQLVLHNSHSGGVCLNDTLLHVVQDDMPFGGIGPSGMGHYHGHEGFLTFSKAKAVLSKQRFNGARSMYPPYGGWLQKLLLKFLIR